MNKEIEDFVKDYVKNESVFWTHIKNMGFRITKRFKVTTSKSKSTGAK